MKMAYSEQLHYADASSSPLNVWKYRTNSIYDPYWPAGGHQPRGRDQIVPFYKRYRVHGLQYQLTITNEQVNSTYVMIGATNLDVAMSSDITLNLERKAVKVILLSPIGSPGSKRILSGYVSNHRLAEITSKEYVEDPKYEALQDDNPIAPLSITFSFRSSDWNGGSPSAVQYSAVLRLMYFVEFFDSVPVLAS